MTSQTLKLPPVTNIAGFLVELEILPIMPVEKVRRVRNRLESRALRVAELAAKGVIDLVMTDQAIRHHRQIAARRRLGFLHPAMAGAASVRSIQLLPQSRRRREVRLRVDRRRDHRRNIPEGQV